MVRKKTIPLNTELDLEVLFGAIDPENCPQSESIKVWQNVFKKLGSPSYCDAKSQTCPEFKAFMDDLNQERKKHRQNN